MKILKQVMIALVAILAFLGLNVALTTSAASAATPCDSPTKTVTYTGATATALGTNSGDTSIATITVVNNTDGSQTATWPVTDTSYYYCQAHGTVFDSTTNDELYQWNLGNDGTPDQQNYQASAGSYMSNITVTFAVGTAPLPPVVPPTIPACADDSISYAGDADGVAGDITDNASNRLGLDVQASSPNATAQWGAASSDETVTAAYVVTSDGVLHSFGAGDGSYAAPAGGGSYDATGPNNITDVVVCGHQDAAVLPPINAAGGGKPVVKPVVKHHVTHHRVNHVVLPTGAGTDLGLYQPAADNHLIQAVSWMVLGGVLLLGGVTMVVRRSRA